MALATPNKRKSRDNKHKNDDSSGETLTLTLEELRALGHQLLSSRAHLNNLPVLLSHLSPSSPLALTLESLISLQSFFTPLLPEIPPSSSPAPGLKPPAAGSEDEGIDPESVYKAWLRARFDEFVSSLIGIAVSSQSSEALRDVALDAIMEFVKQGKDGRFQSAIYHRFLHTIVSQASPVKQLLDLIAAKYFKYIDVRYFTYTSVDKIANNFTSAKTDGDGKMNMDNDLKLSEPRVEVAIHIIHDILLCLSPLELVDKEPSHGMWSQLGPSKSPGKKSFRLLQKSVKKNSEVAFPGQITKKLKLKFTKAWLSFLKLPLPLDVYKEVLPTLHQNVIPYMANPAILCDFLTKSYDIGGVISVMALSGLFILMTKHSLEYPKFYEKLYALLTPAVFMAKHRSVFFQLLDTCLKSTYLPAYLAAAFAKKLSRLALSVPPSGALVVIAIIHNLLRRHPSINFLVHQQIDDEMDTDATADTNESSENAMESAAGPMVRTKNYGVDPFNNEETDPIKSNAMRSSLWEIDTLRHHYCPQVSRFVASLENDLTVRAKTSEVLVADFSSASYATIFKSEMQRRVKQAPVAAVIPTTLFLESDFPGWTFGDMHDGKQEAGDNGATNKDENNKHGPAKRQRIERS